MDRKRLVADRFKRIWSLVEYISDRPGLTRKELAERFALSQRQLQADLNVIRDEIRLPLTRVHGYRFVEARARDPAEKDFTLGDLHTLFLLVHKASGDPSIPREAFDQIVAKLPNAFPPPLQPLVRKTLCPHAGDEFGPTPEERDNCLPYLVTELHNLKHVRVIVCLGAFAWDGALRALRGNVRDGIAIVSAATCAGVCDWCG